MFVNRTGAIQHRVCLLVFIFSRLPRMTDLKTQTSAASPDVGMGEKLLFWKKGMLQMLTSSIDAAMCHRVQKLHIPMATVIEITDPEKELVKNELLKHDSRIKVVEWNSLPTDSSMDMYNISVEFDYNTARDTTDFKVEFDEAFREREGVLVRTFLTQHKGAIKKAIREGDRSFGGKVDFITVPSADDKARFCGELMKENPRFGTVNIQETEDGWDAIIYFTEARAPVISSPARSSPSFTAPQPEPTESKETNPALGELRQTVAAQTLHIQRLSQQIDTLLEAKKSGSFWAFQWDP